jgi:Zn-dependent peptidase ImmA (M78 family)
MTSTLATLRDAVPLRALSFVEALRSAELQASKFHTLAGLAGPPFPEEAIIELPRVHVARMIPAPTSGASKWHQGRWFILVSGADSIGRQRFSLAHEFKHVLDNHLGEVLYPAAFGMTSHERAEAVCDYFAACLLMPRLWLKRAWGSGVQDLRTLANLFQVSSAAMQVRLLQVGLVQSSPRCDYLGAAS